MKCHIYVDSLVLHKPVAYKYCVYTKKSVTFECLDYIQTAHGRMFVNRCLLIPSSYDNKGMLVFSLEEFYNTLK